MEAADAAGPAAAGSSAPSRITPASRRHGLTLLDLARTLLEVATATIVTAADATFALVNDAVARVRKQVKRPAEVSTAVAKRTQAAKARLAVTAR